MMNSENKGYSLAVINGNNKDKKEKVYLKPMALYVPDIATQAVAELISTLSVENAGGKGFILTVTNDAVKDLINVVRGYESDEETNVCGW